MTQTFRKPSTSGYAPSNAQAEREGITSWLVTRYSLIQ